MGRKTSMSPFVFWSVTALGLCTLLFSFAGALHPLGDSLAVFRTQIACLGLIWIALGVWTGAAPASAAVIAIPVAAAMIPALVSYVRPEVPGPTTLYQKNMSFRLADTAPLEEDIRSAAPDVLTLQEVTPANTALLMALEDSLPSQLICPFEAVGAVAVASRWPIVPGSASVCVEGLAAMQVQTERGPLWVAAIHLHWPWPYRQAEERDAIAAALRTLEGPVVLAGDFNMVPWSRTMQVLTDATGTRRAGRTRTTLPMLGRLWSLPIDHAIVPDGPASTETRPLLGSDHMGLLVRF